MRKIAATAAVLLIAVTLASFLPGEAEAQSGRDARVVGVAVDTLSVRMKAQIRDYYAARSAVGAKALPPGIRRNLQRGKRLPPGIAKRTVPDELLARLSIGDGYELVEVGLDVLLVEVATKVIHDVLMDIIR